MSGLFIGLVTHPRSQFPEGPGSHGLMRQLADQLSALGMESHYCEDRDSDSMEELTAKNSLSRRICSRSSAIGRHTYPTKARACAQQWVAVRRAVEPKVRAARRLPVIELAHLEIMTASLAMEQTSPSSSKMTHTVQTPRPWLETSMT